MNPKYNVVIIGAGNIGALYDTPKSKNILTHAHAFTKHKGFKLVGFIDIDKQKAKKAVSIWGGKAFFSIKEAFNKQRIDVAVVAVPDQNHYQVLKKISQFPIKLVFAEKPLTTTLKEADEIVRLYKEKNIPVVVNYSRRFIPEFELIRKNIKSNLYGNYLKGSGYYGKGFLHNGSHTIDLIRFFIGEVQSARITASSFDFCQQDPSLSMVLKLKNKTQFFLQHIDYNLFNIYEIDLLFEKGRIVIKDRGFKIDEYTVKPSKIFPDYKNIIKNNSLNTSLGKSTYHLASNAYNFLTKNEKIKCSLEDGYQAVKICSKIISQFKKENPICLN